MTAHQRQQLKPDAIDPIDTAHMRRVLGRHPTGVAVITSISAEGDILAMVVGTFTSISLSPPLVGFFPDKASTTWPAIAKTGRFLASTLAHDQLSECRALAGKTKDFAGVQWVETAMGLPMPANALATVECDLDSVVDAGDHWLVMGLVREIVAHRDVPPLLFWNGALGDPHQHGRESSASGGR